MEKQLQNTNWFVGFRLLRKPAVAFLKVGHFAFLLSKVEHLLRRGTTESPAWCPACRRPQGNWASCPWHYRLTKRPLWLWSWGGSAHAPSAVLFHLVVTDATGLLGTWSTVNVKFARLHVLAGRKKMKVSLTVSVLSMSRNFSIFNVNIILPVSFLEKMQFLELVI